MLTLIDDQASLDGIVSELLETDRYALDTEFHRERTYYPQVALVQIAWEDRVVLLDPLALDLSALAPVFDGEGVCVIHAGVQDMEVLDLACGAIPKTVFDTQIAAGFLGLATGSLVSLLERYLSITLQKGDRLTDWLQRPLTEAQMNYAAGDVLHLLELADVLIEKLTSAGRLEWAAQESALMRDKPRTRRSPEEAVFHIKEARSLKGEALLVATAVAAWRERRAATMDTPVRQVLPDIGVVAIAQQRPTSLQALNSLRGVDGRHTRKGAAEEILEAVVQGKASEPAVARPRRRTELPKELRPVVTLVTSWIAQLARDHSLDPALLATRSDVEALLSGTDGRLQTGWRSNLVGEPIGHLVAGSAALAFDDGRLVLETRSNQKL